MKTKETSENTIFRTISDHTGQCPISEAKYEIERLEKQFPSTKWRKDFTPFLVDDDFNNPNPSKLEDGNCWMVRDYSSRELAMMWWKKLSIKDKDELQKKYTCNRNFLTVREIECIYNEEHIVKDIPLSQIDVNDICGQPKISKTIDVNDICGQPKISKTNEKQFKTFNSELFQKYIDKFCQEDKEKALKIMMREYGNDLAMLHSMHNGLYDKWLYSDISLEDICD